MSSRPRRRPHRTGLGLWLVPMALLGGIALVVFASLYALDHHVTGGISDPNPPSAIGRYVRFEPTLISDALSGLAGMTAAVLGIVITVVSLLVQLTAELAFRFMNSYLRAALNARAVRTAYNVMNQYRLMVESMIKGGADDIALEGVRKMIYYGRTSYDMQLGFVTETVAYDVSALCEFAHANTPSLDEEMLAMFLELDQPLRLKRQEAGLQGIRKAQIKLACYYLATGVDDRAARIAADMAGEDRERLRSIREQLTRVESKKYWEIIDRGRNFDYMPPREKEQMERFFAMLDAAPPPRSV